MRRFLIPVVCFCSTGCPVVEGPPPTTDETIQAKEPKVPSENTSIFGIKAETAFYKKGTNGAADSLQMTGVAPLVVSPDGQHNTDMQKVVESNLFTEVHPRSPKLKGPELPVPSTVHAWISHLDKQTEIALFNPLYLASTQTLSFDITVIDGPTLHEGSLGNVTLRVQDCPDQTYVCAKSTLTACDKEIGPVGTCWNWLALNCLPCHCSEDMAECKEKNPSCCGHEYEPCYPSRLGPHGWERYCL